MVTLAVGGPQDLDHGSGLSVSAGPRPDRVVTGRVEDRAQVVAAGEAQPLQDAGRLIPDRPDPIDDHGRIGICMRQRQLQVVQDRQPLARDPGPLLGTRPLDVPGAAFAHIVHFRQGAQPLVLQFGDPGLQGAEGGPGVCAAAIRWSSLRQAIARWLTAWTGRGWLAARWWLAAWGWLA